MRKSCCTVPIFEARSGIMFASLDQNFKGKILRVVTVPRGGWEAHPPGMKYRPSSDAPTIVPSEEKP